MMRARLTVVLGLVPALLVAGGVMASDGLAGPTLVVQSPDALDVRASITFPAGWRLEAGEDDTRRQVHALAIDERCELGVRRSDVRDLETDVDDFVLSLAPGSGYIFMARESVALPAGVAERVDFADNEDGGRWSVYAAWDEGHVHELWCRGDELPDDRWSSIAWTLDLDPDPTATSSPFDATTSRPDAGVTMEFGEEWQVRGSSTNQGLLYATSETAVCALSDYSDIAASKGWTDVDAMHDEYVGIASSRDDLSIEQSAYLDMLPGRTGFADILFDDGTRASRWSFADPTGERLMALFCVSDSPPEDHFMALAQTLDWLP